MPYTIFDAHCDTVQKMCDTNQHLAKNNLHISLENMSKHRHIQTFALFIDKKKDPLTPFNRCNQLLDCYFNEINNNFDKISLCTNASDINNAIKSNKIVIKIFRIIFVFLRFKKENKREKKWYNFCVFAV